jgi:hypothetical protein
MAYSTSPSGGYSSYLHSSSLYSRPVVHPTITHPFRYRGSSHSLTNFEDPFPKLPQVAFTFEVGILTNKQHTRNVKSRE